MKSHAKWLSRLLPIVLLGLFFLIPACKSDDDNSTQQGDDPTTIVLTLYAPADITPTSARISAELSNPDNLAISRRGMVWASTADPTVESDQILELAVAGEFVGQLTCLDVASTTHVRAFVETSGQLVYSNNISFSTLDHKIFEGDVLLSDQEEVDAFGAQGYSRVVGNLTIRNFATSAIFDIDALLGLTEVIGDVEISMNYLIKDIDGLGCLRFIDGSLMIGGPDGYYDSNDDLENVDGLSRLREVSGDLMLYLSGCCNALQNIDGFSNLESVGQRMDFRLWDNSNITDLDAFSSLSSIGLDLRINSNLLENVDGLSKLTFIGRDLEIFNGGNIRSLQGLSQLQELPGELDLNRLDKLSSLSELGNLNQIGSIRLSDCPSFTSLGAFENITTLSELSIQGLHGLTDLSEFSNLETITDAGELSITANDGLQDLSGLESLVRVGNLAISGNDNMTSLEGLNNLGYTFNLRVRNNDVLSNFCALTFLFTEGVQEGSYIVSGNAHNPSAQEIIDGTCSL